MAPDPVAIAIARGSCRGYEEVRRALRILEANGWTPERAADLVLELAAQNVDVFEAARGAAQLRSVGVRDGS